MDQDTLLDLVAELTEVDRDSITMESSLEDLEWDSLCNISLIAAVDEETGKTLSGDDLKACTTVADLFALAS
ncbi:MAG: acyl carrier protein [Propionibacteriaceae bacterium]|nr:acyl carrier protein [Propionibacteriaceae bacterium]